MYRDSYGYYVIGVIEDYLDLQKEDDFGAMDDLDLSSYTDSYAELKETETW